MIFKEWLGWEDSNPRMAGPKPAALPLGYTPLNVYLGYLILYFNLKRKLFYKICQKLIFFMKKSKIRNQLKERKAVKMKKIIKLSLMLALSQMHHAYATSQQTPQGGVNITNSGSPIVLSPGQSLQGMSVGGNPNMPQVYSGPIISGSTGGGTTAMVLGSTMSFGLPLLSHQGICNNIYCAPSENNGSDLYTMASKPDLSETQLAGSLSNHPAIRCLLFCSRFKLRPNAVKHIKFFDNIISSFGPKNSPIDPAADQKAIKILAMAMSGKEDESDSPKETLLHRYLSNRKNTSSMPPRAQQVIEDLRIIHCQELARTKTNYMFGPDCRKAATPQQPITMK